MKKDVQEINDFDLIELYSSTEEFIKFLDTEIESMDNVGEENE